MGEEHKMRADNNKSASLTAFVPRDTANGKTLAPRPPPLQLHRDHSTMDTTRVFSATYGLNETVQMTIVSYQGARTVRLMQPETQD